jgi:hypothetical protein
MYPYPHLVQFETRKLELERELRLLHERRRHLTEGRRRAPLTFRVPARLIASLLPGRS